MMCDELNDELIVGQQAAKILVKHMLDMGAGSVKIPVKIDGTEYVVEAMSKALTPDKPFDLTIESCVDTMRDKWKMVDADCRDGDNGLITYHVSAFDEGLAYYQALTAKLREEIRIMLEVDNSRREQLAGMQAMLRQKDEALKLALDADFGADYGNFDKVKNALALTSPSAALEAVRAEDRAKLERYEQMPPIAWMIPERCDQDGTIGPIVYVQPEPPFKCDGWIPLFNHTKE